jgi:hypothetical protein
VREYIDQLRDDGFAVMKSVIPQEEIAALRESITVTTNQHSSKAAPQSYVGSLLRYNQDIAQHIANDRLLQLCRILFGPHVRVSTISGSVNAPGVKRGDFHVDWPYSERDETCIRGQGASTLAHLVTIWMLTDFTVQNGATIAIPGSHRLREQGIMPGDFAVVVESQSTSGAHARSTVDGRRLRWLRPICVTALYRMLQHSAPYGPFPV